jgi:hypothetical protein
VVRLTTIVTVEIATDAVPEELGLKLMQLDGKVPLFAAEVLVIETV